MQCEYFQSGVIEENHDLKQNIHDMQEKKPRNIQSGIKKHYC